MNLTGREVLVTGAGGFIGSHLADKLVESGARVRAFVHYNALGSWGWLDDSPCAGYSTVIAGDICDKDRLRAAMEGVDTVFHLAALISIPYSYHAPASYIRTNVEGTMNVLQVARETGVRLVVHTSTSEVYGTARSIPIDEDHPLQAQSPYAATKIAADKLAESFHLSYGLPVVTVRPFNAFGPRQSARAIIPSIISQALSGDTIRLGNLAPTRDLNYVSNTVSGFLLAASKPDVLGKTINLGSGQEVSIREVVHMVGELTGRPIRIEQEEVRCRGESSEVERLCADSSRAKLLLGWTPLVDFRSGLEMTIDWIRQNMARYRTERYEV